MRDQIRARVAMLAPSKAQPRRTCGGWGHASEALSWRSSRLNREWYELQHRRHQEDNENAAEPGPMGIAPFRMQSRADQVRGAERRPKAAMKWRPKSRCSKRLPSLPPSLSLSLFHLRVAFAETRRFSSRVVATESASDSSGQARRGE